jgi:predicted metal-dependent hydrolase
VNANQNSESYSSEIVTRKPNLDYDAIKNCRFYDTNIVKSAYIGAFSAAFPAYELDMIKTVRGFEKSIHNEQLKHDVKAFIKQEGQHTQQHKLLNNRLLELGFDVKNLESETVTIHNKFTSNLSDIEKLALYAAFEHLSTILSEGVLKQVKMVTHCDQAVSDIMLWHCAEELEHKSVVYDVYMECVGDKKLLNKIMRKTSLYLTKSIMKNIIDILRRAEERTSFKEIVSFLILFFGWNGIFWTSLKPFYLFFRKDFHPRQYDTNKLLEDWKKRHEARVLKIKS